MLRWLFLAVLVIAITGVVTVAFQTPSTQSTPLGGVTFPVDKPAPSGPSPKAVVDGDLVYQFGSKAQHTSFEKDWIIHNEGKAPLELNLEAPPCSCTAANFQGKDGKPGGKTVVVPIGGEIPLHFTWQTLSNNGHYQKTASILTNDPLRSRIVFTADGQVQPAVVVYPSEDPINFLEISTDQPTYKNGVAVFSPDRPDMNILSMSSSKPGLIVVDKEPLTADDLKVLKTTKGWRVNITVNRGMPLGDFREEIVIKTDHEKRGELRLTVYGKMVGAISVVPEGVRLNDITSSTGGSRELNVIVRGQKTTKFEVVSKPEKVKVEFVKNDKETRVSKYKMIVTIPPGTPAGEIDDTIVVKTDHPLANEIRVPIRGLIRDPG